MIGDDGFYLRYYDFFDIILHDTVSFLSRQLSKSFIYILNMSSIFCFEKIELK